MACTSHLAPRAQSRDPHLYKLHTVTGYYIRRSQAFDWHFFLLFRRCFVSPLRVAIGKQSQGTFGNNPMREFLSNESTRADGQ